MFPKSHLLIRWLVALTLVIALSVQSTPSVNAQESDVSTKIDAYLKELTSQNRFSGAVLIAKGDDVIFSSGYGYANLDWMIPNTPQTVFQISSITMQFAAMGILKLQEMGKLNVQDPICDYVANCPEGWQPITIHHLLTHTSGLDSGGVPMMVVSPPAQGIKEIMEKPLRSPAGTNFSYSNSNYVVLGMIIQKVYKKPFKTFLLNEIIKPLALSSTAFGDYSRIVKNRAIGYESQTKVAPNDDLSTLDAAGAIISTVEDLHRWTRALFTGKFISMDSLDAMLKVSIPIPGGSFDAYYAYGLIHQADLIGHFGVMYGFTSQLNYYPEEEVTVVVLSNLGSASSGDIASFMWSSLTGK